MCIVKETQFGVDLEEMDVEIEEYVHKLVPCIKHARIYRVSWQIEKKP